MIDRTIVGAVALLAAAGVAYACGGRAESEGSTPEDPAAECAAYYDGVQTRDMCGNTPSDAGVNESARASFIASCVAQNMLPGTHYAEAMQACGNALAAMGCNQFYLPLACELGPPGTLPGGAACSDRYQCASLVCTGDPALDDGGIETLSCGTCEAVASPGAQCFNGTVGGCGPGEVCGEQDTCVTAPTGNLGSPCRIFACNPGFACSATSNTCVTASPPGGLCNYPWDCAPNLVCFSGACTYPLTAGEACGGEDCASGLACDSTGHCAATTWSVSNGPCDATHICPVGGCSVTDGGAGTCPTVGAAGQPCMQTVGSTAVCGDGLYCGGGVCMTTPTRPTCN